MLRHKGLTLAGVAFALVALATPASGADKEKVLFRFNYANGMYPYGPVIFDQSGNLYGMTAFGSAYEGGNVYELSHTPEGHWKETVLYTFCPNWNCESGILAYGGLVFDTAGNLYGVALGGGAYNSGVVFELSPNLDGSWTESVLHDFGGAGDGIAPECETLLLDSAGNLYGTTAIGGSGSCDLDGYPGCGTVFELSPGQGGIWNEKILYSFQNNGKDGNYPYAGLIADNSGNLYGTTSGGGLSSRHCFNRTCGVVFKLSPNADGNWTETILHSFGGRDGESPTAGLTIDAAGNLYGVTALGGRYDCSPPYGCGTVFELTPDGNGSWTEKVLRAFYKGRYPRGAVILDPSGNIYGTTWVGGRHYDQMGTVFELSPGTNGKWIQTILHNFGAARDGQLPGGGLVFDSAGNLYGTTEAGGLPGDHKATCDLEPGCGTVFEVTRNAGKRTLTAAARP